MKKNILVIGTGSIASRHTKNILRIDKSSTIDVLSSDYDRSCIFCKQFGRNRIKPIRYNNVIDKDYTHVVIASNTLLHNKYILINYYLIFINNIFYLEDYHSH